MVVGQIRFTQIEGSTMRIFAYSASLIILSFYLTTGHAQSDTRTVTVQSGFIDANTYIAYSEEQKAIYVIGLIEGALLAPLFGAAEVEVQALLECIKPMNNIQVAAIITKYVEENPEKWHQGAHVLGYAALMKACLR
ncbi:hypothetical protein PHACT_12470 [Pseudohongiella acticola]|uniref:Rap1a immunity protein domain-containing protein n=2 Tax=Pseudohongiella acticola TaxID=1524254 RepID=A0A1E8CGB0_9GAMM|nr:hypothetical protein PHACT_12470 [Pseudohongiella acticola]